MTVNVTMLQTRLGEDGTYWTAGSVRTATDDFARLLITSNLATGTLPPPDRGIKADGDPWGSSSVSGDGAPGRRRPVLPRQLIAPTTSMPLIQTNGTVTVTDPNPPFGAKRFVCLASAASGVRAFASSAVANLDTSKYYMLQVRANAVNIQAGLSDRWLQIAGTVTESSVPLSSNGLSYATTPIAVGLNGFVFRPGVTSITVRCGIGCNSNATLTAGDSLDMSELAVYEVDSLTDTEFRPWSYSPRGTVGYDAVPVARAPASCVLCVGDSWTNDSGDWPGRLGTLSKREVLVSATGGHTLASIFAALQAWWASSGVRYAPSYNVPGVLVAQGGINSILGDVPVETMRAQLDQIWDFGLSRGLPVVPVIPALATNAAAYTAARGLAAAAVAQHIIDSGLPYVDARAIVISEDGTANATNMLEEAGAWIHPTDAGHIAIAAAVDAVLKQYDNTARPAVAWA
jgi:lysophospholipase L1-like esterase